MAHHLGTTMRLAVALLLVAVLSGCASDYTPPPVKEYPETTAAQPEPTPTVTRTPRPTLGVEPRTVEPKPSPKPQPTHYASCEEVRKAGNAPIRRGDPGYSRRLDRDGDGVGCERRRLRQVIK